MSLEKPQYVSDLVVYLLHALGVDYATLNPGATTRGLHESLVTYGGNIRFLSAAGGGHWGAPEGALPRRRCQNAVCFPTKFFLRIGTPIPISRRFGPRTDRLTSCYPTEIRRVCAVSCTGDSATS